MDDIEESKALTAALSAYYYFHQWQYEQIVKPRNIKYASLLPDEQHLLPWYSEHTNQLALCIEQNKVFLQSVALHMAPNMGVPADPSQWHDASDDDFDRVRSILLQLAREWSDEGAKERGVFNAVIGKLNARYPLFEKRQEVGVLVPGCGLGRLVYDLVLNGYKVHGNEFSYHMLIMSNFILNYCSTPFTIYPYIMKLSNVNSRKDQLRSVVIPNNIGTDEFQRMQQKHPTVPFDSLMSISAGSFTDLFGPDNLQSNFGSPNEFRAMNHHTFDSVITCFFIDTASNIVEYLKTIRHCMQPTGLWLNVGPLLWHYEGDFNMMFLQRLDQQVPSIMKGLELSREDLLQLILATGFEFEFLGCNATQQEKMASGVRKEAKITTIYASDQNLLSNFVYNCEFWGCRNAGV